VIVRWPRGKNKHFAGISPAAQIRRGWFLLDGPPAAREHARTPVHRFPEELNRMTRRDNEPTPPAGVVNWNAPQKKDLVERAMEDGIHDAAKIAKWAKDHYKVDLTTDEIESIKKSLAKDEGTRDQDR
jgi:hypothetical protein